MERIGSFKVMFTGIVETVGQLMAKKSTGKAVRFRFGVSGIQDDMKIGDSLATNGVCLTVVDFGPDFVVVDVVGATLKATNLKQLKRGQAVNFERSLKVSDRLGGHWVQGHVDGVGRVKRISRKGKDWLLEIKASRDLQSHLVPKGSISVNGASLTLQQILDDSFIVSIIPHTWDVTNFKYLKAQDMINLEIDILAKYLRHFIHLAQNPSR